MTTSSRPSFTWLIQSPGPPVASPCAGSPVRTWGGCGRGWWMTSRWWTAWSARQPYRAATLVGYSALMVTSTAPLIDPENNYPSPDYQVGRAWVDVWARLQ